MNDFFPRMTMKPNVECDEFHCRDRQKTFAKSEDERKKKEALTKVHYIVQVRKMLGI